MFPIGDCYSVNLLDDKRNVVKKWLIYCLQVGPRDISKDNQSAEIISKEKETQVYLKYLCTWADGAISLEHPSLVLIWEIAVCFNFVIANMKI